MSRERKGSLLLVGKDFCLTSTYLIAGIDLENFGKLPEPDQKLVYVQESKCSKLFRDREEGK